MNFSGGMQTSFGVRLRMALRQRKNLPVILAGCVLFLLFVLFLLEKIPSEHRYEALTDDEAHKYESAGIEDLFPGKCKIKNFNTLRRMSIVYTWVNGSQPCYRAKRELAGGKKAIGGSRDREIGELKYSIRSLKKNLPWHIVSISSLFGS
jgi:hypothetical protein